MVVPLSILTPRSSQSLHGPQTHRARAGDRGLQCPRGSEHTIAPRRGHDAGLPVREVQSAANSKRRARVTSLGRDAISAPARVSTTHQASPRPEQAQLELDRIEGLRTHARVFCERSGEQIRVIRQAENLERSRIGVDEPQMLHTLA